LDFSANQANWPLRVEDKQELAAGGYELPNDGLTNCCFELLGCLSRSFILYTNKTLEKQLFEKLQH